MSDQTVTRTLGQSAPLELHPQFRRTARRPRRTDALRVASRVATDAASLLVATLAVATWDGAAPRPWLLVLASAGIMIAFACGGLYTSRLLPRIGAEMRRVLIVTALAAVGIAAVELAFGSEGIGDGAIRFWLLAAALTSAARVALQTAEHVTRRARPEAIDGATLIVGAGRVGHRAAQRLMAEPQLGLRPIGFLDKEPLAADVELVDEANSGLPVLGASWNLEEVVAEHDVKHVLVAFSTAPSNVVLDLVHRCWRLGVSVMVVPRLYEVEGRRARTEHLGALPVVTLHPSDPRSWQFTVKYAIDRIVASVALLLLSPVLAVVALCALAALGRPLFFRQQRVGRDGHVFDMLKFRTMHGVPEEGGEADAAWAAQVLGGGAGEPGAAAPPAVDRRSRVGDILRKLSLDELPQLWNIVRGDMSIVGPRPERIQYVRRFEDVVYRYGDRHRVKSGLTGWAQVHGLRGETSLADRIEWDNFYIENWSLWLDLKIAVMTLPALVGRRGGH